jgi:CHASE3 domain sensor protein
MAQVMRTPGIARSIVILLASALVLLLVVNLSTFVMIQRTAVFNDRVEHIQMTRRSARTLLISMIDAETGQRGFLLTGRPTFLAPYSQAVADAPAVYQGLISATVGDPATEASAQSIIRISRAKLAEMEATLVLARTGQIGQAIQQVRGGEGQRLMDELRTEVMRFDTLQGERQLALTAVTERSATLTVVVNAIAGVLILVLAGIILLLVRRYINDMAEARTIVDRTNAGLEQTVRDRTAALTRANEEVQRFAYIVSHDLRSPLVNVMGFTSELEAAGQVIDRQISRLETDAPDLIESDAVTAVREEIPESIGFIRASTEKMDRLINAIWCPRPWT